MPGFSNLSAVLTHKNHFFSTKIQRRFFFPGWTCPVAEAPKSAFPPYVVRGKPGAGSDTDEAEEKGEEEDDESSDSTLGSGGEGDGLPSPERARVED